jgi:hypothetical protein
LVRCTSSALPRAISFHVALAFALLFAPKRCAR